MAQNFHNNNFQMVSYHAKLSIMLMSLEKHKTFFKRFDYPTRYKMVNLILRDYWKWLTNKDSFGQYFSYIGHQVNELEESYMSAQYLYWNHCMDFLELFDFPDSDENQIINHVSTILGDVVYFGADLAMRYDYGIRGVDTDLPSDIGNVTDGEYISSTLTTSVLLADDPEKEKQWQQKALDKLLKHHHVDKVGEWGPPITKDFFDDIVV